MINDIKFWERYFKVYDVLNQVIPYDRLLNTLVKETNVRSGQNILDLGSGTGNLGLHLPPDSFVTFFDQSSAALQVAKFKHPNSKILQGNMASKLPFPNSDFDTIFCNNALYTLPYIKWNYFLTECHRVLKSGGILVLSNIKSGFSAKGIYLEHIKMSMREKGWRFTVKQVLKLIVPTLKMFKYNSCITRANDTGSYHFLHIGQQSELLRAAGFAVLGCEKLVYAGQALMVVGRKT